uniref:Uncharacterized protein n=1 Tax=candidate division WOR-3 bacterium TaxID=2052148 RepID=A0A7V3ZYS4_UNCW3
MLNEELKQAEPSSFEEKEIEEFIDKFSEKIVNLNLSVIAVVTLESIKPLSFFASQAMVFFEPLIKAFFTVKDYEKLYRILEDRKLLEKLITSIEEKADRR